MVWFGEDHDSEGGAPMVTGENGDAYFEGLASASFQNPTTPSTAFSEAPPPPPPPPPVAPPPVQEPTTQQTQPDPWLVPLPVVYQPAPPPVAPESPPHVPPGQQAQPPAWGLMRGRIFGIPWWILAGGAAIWWFTRRKAS